MLNSKAVAYWIIIYECFYFTLVFLSDMFINCTKLYILFKVFFYINMIWIFLWEVFEMAINQVIIFNLETNFLMVLKTLHVKIAAYMRKTFLGQIERLFLKLYSMKFTFWNMHTEFFRIFYTFQLNLHFLL